MPWIPQKDRCDCYIAGDYWWWVHGQKARFEEEDDDAMPITVQDRGSVWKEPGPELLDDMKAGVSDGAEAFSSAVSQDFTMIATEQAASQGVAPNMRSMQSSAMAQDCVPSRDGASTLVHVIQARAGWWVIIV